MCVSGADAIRRKVSDNTATPDEIRELADYDSGSGVNQPDSPQVDTRNNIRQTLDQLNPADISNLTPE